jgi:hypothetical protein
LPSKKLSKTRTASPKVSKTKSSTVKCTRK